MPGCLLDHAQSRGCVAWVGPTAVLPE